MKLIVGLGNPGKKYEKTRHNAGFLILDYFSKLGANAEIDGFEAQVSWKEERSTPYLGYSPQPQEVIFVKPQDFMNNSGLMVKKLVKEKKVILNDLLVIHDDLDIPLGSYKLQFGKGPRQHNGILSIEETLKTKDFYRLRVGIENRSKISSQGGLISSKLPSEFGSLRSNQKYQRSKLTGEEYVLSNFTEDELKQLESEVLPKAACELKNWLLKKKNA